MCLWTTMIQIALSFLAGVYVGTEYEMRPYLEQIREAASRLEKKPPPAPEESTEKPAAKGWFGWSSEKKEK